MQGVALKYHEDGLVDFDFTVKNERRAALVDSVLINLGTERGSCPIFAERGVDMLKRALRGYIFDRVSAQHHANFSAQETLFFLLEQDPQPDDLFLTDIKLTPDTITLERLSMNAQLAFSDGTTVGLDASAL